MATKVWNVYCLIFVAGYSIDGLAYELNVLTEEEIHNAEKIEERNIGLLKMEMVNEKNLCFRLLQPLYS